MLAEQWGMAPPGLYAYFNNKTKPGAHVLMRLHEIGYSIEWLLTGEGRMFANNDAGRQLQREAAGIEDVETPTNVGARLKLFTDLELFGADNLAEKIGKPVKEVEAYFADKRELKTSVLRTIAELGCNLNWLLTGEGEMRISALQRQIPFGNLLRDTNQEYTVQIKVNRGRLSFKQLGNSHPNAPNSQTKPSSSAEPGTSSDRKRTNRKNSGSKRSAQPAASRKKKDTGGSSSTRQSNKKR